MINLHGTLNHTNINGMFLYWLRFPLKVYKKVQIASIQFAGFVIILHKDSFHQSVALFTPKLFTAHLPSKFCT